MPRSRARGAAAARARQCTLAGGDDYELLFTAPPERADAVRAAARQAGVAVTRIGSMGANPGCGWSTAAAGRSSRRSPDSTTFAHDPAPGPALDAARAAPAGRSPSATRCTRDRARLRQRPRAARPGTFGTLFAWATFFALQPLLASPVLWAAWLVAGVAVGCWACAATARHLSSADPGCIVWDEVIAFWIVLWLIMPAGWLAQAVAFALFRFFDAAKPGPVAWADALFKPQRDNNAGVPVIGWRQGLGIMLDDLVAALWHAARARSVEISLGMSDSLEFEVAALGDALRARGWMLATAESCTGGLIAAACTAVAGSSDWFERGIVSYSNAAKVELLGVPAALIAAHGAVSAEVARDGRGRVGPLEGAAGRRRDHRGPRRRDAGQPVARSGLPSRAAGAGSPSCCSSAATARRSASRRCATRSPGCANGPTSHDDDPGCRRFHPGRMGRVAAGPARRTAGRDAGRSSRRGRPSDIDIAIVANPPPGALAGLPNLRLVQSLWAGVEKLLADPTVPAHVPLARMVDPAMNEAMAETALWAVLAAARLL